MSRVTKSLAIAAVVAALAPAGISLADARPDDRGGSIAVPARSGAHHRDSAVATGFMATDRNTVWTQTQALHLDFPTYHPEGLVVTRDRIFLSSTQIIEPTVKFPSPQGGYDRTPGKGVGHLFVMDRAGKLLKDIILGDGKDIYHPGGIDTDGRNIWVPVAEYRPNSASIIYRVDAKTLAVRRQFATKDHFGGIVLDKTTNHLVGNTWGSRKFVEWTLSGRQVDAWTNESYFIDYQDCQYVANRKMLCGGITNLPQTPAAGGASQTYELGGMALVDLRSHGVLHEVPFQQFSPAGHVMTRNPLKLEADGTHLTLRVAPDNGEETAGTNIYTYEATVTPSK